MSFVSVSSARFSTFHGSLDVNGSFTATLEVVDSPVHGTMWYEDSLVVDTGLNSIVSVGGGGLGAADNVKSSVVEPKTTMDSGADPDVRSWLLASTMDSGADPDVLSLLLLPIWFNR